MTKVHSFCIVYGKDTFGMKLLNLIVLGLAAYAFFQAVGTDKVNIANFVPFNSYNVPYELPVAKDLPKGGDKFTTLFNAVNGTKYALSYQLGKTNQIFQDALNNSGIGKFTVLAVGSTEPFSLHNVVIQDVNTMAVTRLFKVDFILDEVTPLKIIHIVITPDKQYKTNQKVEPIDEMREELFQLKNRAGLFYPYPTSQDMMLLNEGDKTYFNETLKEKAASLQNMASQNAVTTGTVVSIPASGLPTQLSNEIVGTGPLHPLGT